MGRKTRHYCGGEECPGHRKQLLGAVVGIIIVFAVFNVLPLAYPYTPYPGGWEANVFLTENSVVHAQHWSGALYDYKVPGITGYTNYEFGKTGEALGGETTADLLAIGQPQVPSGSASVIVNIRPLGHYVVNPLTGELVTALRDTDYVQDIVREWKPDANTSATWHGVVHYYGFQIIFKTDAAILNQYYLGGAHAGNTAGSYGKPENVETWLRFQISPWVITTGRETAPVRLDNGSIKDAALTSGFAGIVGAVVYYDPVFGYVEGSPTPTAGGTAYPYHQRSDSLNMRIPDGSLVQQLQWMDPHIKGLPSTVDIQINSGSMLAGAKIDYAPDPNIQVANVYIQYYVVVKVVQTYNYAITVGKENEQGTPGGIFGLFMGFFNQLFAALGGGFTGFINLLIIVVALYLAVRILPGLLRRNRPVVVREQAPREQPQQQRKPQLKEEVKEAE